MKLGEKIQREIESRGIGMHVFAKQAGIVPSTLYAICKKDSCQTEHLVKICNALNISPCFFLGGDNKTETFEMRHGVKKSSFAEDAGLFTSGDLLQEKERLIQALQKDNDTLRRVVNKFTSK